MGLLDIFRTPRGEISALRSQTLGNLAGRYLLNSGKVDYPLARQLYRNTADNYKLGAWAAKPVVNTIAGFMGAPRFMHRDKDDSANGVLDALGSWDSKFLQLNRNTSRDGDAYARLELRPNRFNPQDVQLEMRLIPPEWVTPMYDPLTGELKEVVIAWPAERQTRVGSQIRNEGTYHIVEILTPDERTLEVDGNAPEEVRRLIRERSTLEAEDWRWGFIPIVQFRNDAEETHVYGMSDLEPIEPFMRAYHDVLMASLQGTQTMARPKTQFRVADVKAFLERNFTPEEIKNGELNFAGKDIFLAEQNDTIEFIVADTGLTGVTSLLEFLFYCIVDVSQTPEFAFGTAVASSKASVSEQMPVLARNIRRKRGEFSEPYAEIAEMYLAMQAQLGEVGRLDSYRVEIEWEELTSRDDSEVAATINTLIAGMATGVEAGLVSLDSAIDFIAEFMPTMLPASTEGNESDERQRIAAGRAFLDRLDAGAFGDEDRPPAPPGLRPVENA